MVPRLRWINSAAALAALAGAVPGAAAWRAGSEDVAAAAREPAVAAVLAEVDRIDAATIADDHAAFAASLAGDLVVNNPQNGISVRGATGRRSAAGQISYSRYDRTIEYAGMRGGMVLLMGEERVVPKGGNQQAGSEVRRRFTDLWRNDGGRWLLTARQATIVAPR